MKIVVFILSVVSNICFAQGDSINFANANWSTVKVSRGILLKSFHFDSTLFNSNQNINVLSVQNKKCKCDLSVGYEREILKLTSDFGKESGSIAALNGTFFDTKKGGSVDYIRAKGQVVNQNIYTKTDRGVHQKAALAFLHGVPEIIAWNNTPQWEDDIRGEDVMVSGPLLILNSKTKNLDSSAFTFTRHPRTLVVTKRNETLLITIDGRNEKAQGMTLYELIKISQWLGAVDAINLDGGGSTTLWIYDKPGNGVVNYPTDNKQWDHEGERKVANVILVKKKK